MLDEPAGKGERGQASEVTRRSEGTQPRLVGLARCGRPGLQRSAGLKACGPRDAASVALSRMRPHWEEEGGRTLSLCRRPLAPELMSHVEARARSVPNTFKTRGCVNVGGLNSGSLSLVTSDWRSPLGYTQHTHLPVTWSARDSDGDNPQFSAPSQHILCVHQALKSQQLLVLTPLSLLHRCSRYRKGSVTLTTVFPRRPFNPLHFMFWG